MGSFPDDAGRDWTLHQSPVALVAITLLFPAYLFPELLPQVLPKTHSSAEALKRNISSPLPSTARHWAPLSSYKSNMFMVGNL